MNMLNRILIVLELVVLSVASLASISLLLFDRPAIQDLLGPALAALAAQAININQVICLGVLVLLLAFGVLLLLLEFQRPSARRLRIQSVEGTEVLMTADAITQQLEYSLDALTDVIKVKPQVVAAGKNQGVDVFIEMWTSADVDVRTKTEEAAGVARHVIEDKLGLKVGRVQIKLDQMRPPAKRLVGKTTARQAGGEKG